MFTEIESIEGATVEAKGSKVTVKGANGEIVRDFGSKIEVSMDGKKIKISADSLAMLHTVRGHITNMMNGVTKGYEKKMKILFAHFPMSVEVKGREVIIKNFIGEKHPRKAKVKGNVKIIIKGQEILISGVNKEDVGQTAANLRTATKITKKDCRIFQDGIYPTGD